MFILLILSKKTSSSCSSCTSCLNCHDLPRRLSLLLLSQTRRFGMKLGLDSMRALGAVARQSAGPFALLFTWPGRTERDPPPRFANRACALRASARDSTRHRISSACANEFKSTASRFPRPTSPRGWPVVRQAVDQQLDHEITFFELMSALAPLVFRARKKSTGSCGKPASADGSTPRTSSCRKSASSPISALDHQQYLGGTLAEDRGRRKRASSSRACRS